MRIIQDSDDELEDDVEAVHPPPKQPEASKKQVAIKESVQSDGSGSTESLKRAILEAHRVHLQSQPSQPEPRSSVSLPEQPSKRRKTDESNLGQLQKNNTDHETARDASVVSPETPWSLVGHMHDQYAGHDPRALFPEPSSTIPFATLTQQRILAGVNAPAMLGQDSAQEPLRQLLPPEASVPFSELLNLSSADTIDYTSSRHDQVPLDDPLPSGLLYEDDVLTRGKLASSAKPEGNLSPVEEDQFNRLVAPTWQTSVQDLGTIPTISSNSSRPPRSGSKESLHAWKKQIITLVKDDDQLEAIDLPEEQYKPRPSRSRSVMVKMNETIDYSAKPEKLNKTNQRRRTTASVIELAKHTTPQKVRQICDMGFTPSSTERALKQNGGNVTQTVDWLVSNGIGEDELAPGNTPRKSGSKHYHQSPAMDPETIKVIMRDLDAYRKDSTAIALNVADTVVASDTITPAPIVDGKLQQSIVDVGLDKSSTRGSNVQVVIPSKSPSPRDIKASITAGTRAKRRKTTLDQPESLPVIFAATEVPVEKKRGRGRPKKADRMNVSAEVVPDDKQEEQAQDMQQGQPKPALEVIEPDLDSRIGVDGNRGKQNFAHESLDSKNDTHVCTSTTVQLAEIKSAQTLETATNQGSRSPKNNDRVRYRVGLSRRARIAPLLRTLKK